MAGISLQRAQEQLDLWLEANKAVSSGQSYTINSANGGRTLTRANATEILNQIKFWEDKVSQIINSSKKKARNRVYRVVPRDL